MPSLVVDSSVAVKWFVVEPYAAEAQRILDGYQNNALSFLAPDLINAEFGNIIWKKHLFQGLDAADAQNIMDAFSALQFTIIPTATLLELDFPYD
jgi:predicted nucleic acid-binding protein